MKRLALTLALLAALCAVAGAQTAQGSADDEKRRDIVRLLEVSKAADAGLVIMEQVTNEMRGLFTSLPDEQRERIFKIYEEEMQKEFSREKMIETIAPIYEKHLSAEDVKGLISFYESPLGRRAVEVLPLITREAYEEGARRGQEAAHHITARLISEGLLTPPDPLVLPKPKPKPQPRRRRG
jgi:uncharacterized protein